MGIYNFISSARTCYKGYQLFLIQSYKLLLPLPEDKNRTKTCYRFSIISLLWFMLNVMLCNWNETTEYWLINSMFEIIKIVPVNVLIVPFHLPSSFLTWEKIIIWFVFLASLKDIARKKNWNFGYVFNVFILCFQKK